MFSDSVSSASTVSTILNDIDLGADASVQYAFAQMQLVKAQSCKTQAEDYMKQIEALQSDQKTAAEMIQKARALKAAAKTSGATAAMPSDMASYFKAKGLAVSDSAAFTSDEWTTHIQTLSSYETSIGNKTQTMMVYLQDAISQYNSYLQGASATISKTGEVLRDIARTM